jgi:tetratricopeptide (TPR) repeat protein
VNWLATTSRPWLLVLDDLSDPADLEGLWPTGPTGKALVTTTDATSLPGDRQELVFPVGVFSPREALTYLIGRLTADTDQRLGAVDMVADLGCEPLALAQASAVIASSALSCRDYRDFFCRRRTALAGGAVDPPPAAAVTWTFSFEQAERLSPGGAAQALLALSALLDGLSLNGALMTGPAIAYWNQIVTTSDRILGPSHWDTLVAGERLAEAYVSAGRAAEAVPWFRWALAKRMRTAGSDPAAASAAQLKLGQALVAAKQFTDAITVLEDAVRDLERTGGPDDSGVLRARDELAAAYRAGDQASHAMRLYKQTLADRERIWGPQHPETTTTREKLADAAMADGRVKEAIRHYKRALADREEVLRPDHPDTIAARGNLGYAYHTAGRMASALQLYEQDCGIRAGARRRPPGYPGPPGQPGARLLHRWPAHRRDGHVARHRRTVRAGPAARGPAHPLGAGKPGEHRGRLTAGGGHRSRRA